MKKRTVLQVKKDIYKEQNMSKKKLLNRFVICLDSSGSMRSISREAVDAFNSNVSTVRDGAKQSNQKSSVGLITFGEGRGNVVEKFFNKEVSALKVLDYDEFRPEGMTPMLDAIGLAITKLKKLKDNKDTSYVVIVITDGEENDSRHYSAQSLKKLMKDCQATDRWTFAFLVPPNSKHSLCERYGIPQGNVQEWEASSAGMAKAAAAVSVGVSSYYLSRSSGQKSTRGFFTTDMSQVKSKQVKAQLDNLANQFAMHKVPKECAIREFVEDMGHTFNKGDGFYQLTKDETVQSYKEILIMEKGKKAIYGGSDARDLLGLPDLNVKVRPGNHANFDIFVQSTSVNRKLVRGTTFLYRE
jgi:uncharacterized protein YegL